MPIIKQFTYVTGLSFSLVERIKDSKYAFEQLSITSLDEYLQTFYLDYLKEFLFELRFDL